MVGAQSSTGAREMLVVVGLAAVGLLMVAVVTFGPLAGLYTRPTFAPVVGVSVPEAPLP
jgi:hypothetical protein